MARVGDGRALEELVATIEGLLVPSGFTVDKNWRVCDDAGVQIAELDIVIRGTVGSADYSWLLECRDRPSDGPAPGSWIEQLSARRSRFHFDKVTAVSTTGFAAGAVAYAASAGVDLREVHEVAPELFAWLGLRTVRGQEKRLFMHDGLLGFGEIGSEELVAALMAAVGGTLKDAPLLRSTETGMVVSVLDAFVGAVGQNPSLWDGVVPNGPAKRVQFRAEYARDDSHFDVDTRAGPFRVLHIDFDGELSIQETQAPLSRVAEYRHVGKDKTVAQTAGFIMPMPIHGRRVALELHHLNSTGELHMSLRDLGSAAEERPEETFDSGSEPPSMGR